MKKTLFSALCFLWFLASAASLEAATDGRTERGPFLRPFLVLGRGVLNAAGSPFEISSTLVREIEIHRWVFPATYPFRLGTNLVVRAVSISHDVAILPWVVPFTDDLSPVSEGMGLPDYPWQIG